MFVVYCIVVVLVKFNVLLVVVEGNRTCDHVTGEYACRPGYIGITCQHPCPLGTYGRDCLKKCNCKNGADCHHVTGMLLFMYIIFINISLILNRIFFSL